MRWIGGSVRPMGRTTRTFYKLYARAERMESIVLVNLMFETIGSTTYRLADAMVAVRAICFSACVGTVKFSVMPNSGKCMALT